MFAPVFAPASVSALSHLVNCCLTYLSACQPACLPACLAACPIHRCVCCYQAEKQRLAATIEKELLAQHRGRRFLDVVRFYMEKNGIRNKPGSWNDGDVNKCEWAKAHLICTCRSPSRSHPQPQQLLGACFR